MLKWGAQGFDPFPHVIELRENLIDELDDDSVKYFLPDAHHHILIV